MYLNFNVIEGAELKLNDKKWGWAQGGQLKGGSTFFS